MHTKDFDKKALTVECPFNYNTPTVAGLLNCIKNQ